MGISKRTVRTRSIWSLALLLAGVLVFLGSVVTVSTAAGYGLLFPSLAAVLVVASVIVAIGAVAAGSHVEDKSKRMVLIWSLWSLALLLAAVVISLGFGAIFSTPECQRNADACAFVYGFQLWFLLGALGVPSVIAAIVAAIVALSSAGRLGKRGWFLGILLYLIGCVISTVALFLVFGSNSLLFGIPFLVVLLLLLLMPIITLIYSLSSRERSKGT